MRMGSGDAMVAVLALVTALLTGLAFGWHEVKANPDWQTLPVVHAADGPVVVR